MTEIKEREIEKRNFYVLYIPLCIKGRARTQQSVTISLFFISSHLVLSSAIPYEVYSRSRFPASVKSPPLQREGIFEANILSVAQDSFKISSSPDIKRNRKLTVATNERDES